MMVAVLSACGGTDPPDLADRSGLQAQATAWENRMPGIYVPGEQACTPLVVAFAIRAGSAAFPPELKATRVYLGKTGYPDWEHDVSASETGISSTWVSDVDWTGLVGSVDGKPPPGYRTEQVLHGVARGCATTSFQEGDKLRLSILVATS